MEKKTVVLSWGRMNPPTKGHEKLIQKIKDVALMLDATPLVYLSHSQDPIKNPLTYSEKIYFAKKAFGDIIQRSSSHTIIEVLRELDSHYTDLVLVVGEDRISQFQNLLNRYNGVEYQFDSIQIISAGLRFESSAGVESISASIARNLVLTEKFHEFEDIIPTKLSQQSKSLYRKIRIGMICQKNI